MKNKINVLEGNISRHMFRLAIPSIGAMCAMTVYNLTDTYFVSKLGTEALAAMGFTFPIILMIGAISSGISMGAGSLLARAMGNNNHHKMKRIATDGILLAVLIVAFISIVCLATMKPLFTALGADETTLPLVMEYMGVWYAGVIVVIMPPISDTCMRAMGDMIRPLAVTLVCAIVNIILDPILIFGLFGLPAMGIKGAAVATLVSRFFGMIISLSFVKFHYKLLDFRYNSIREMFQSWHDILGIGIPGALVRLLPQVIRMLLTRVAATVVGGVGVAALAAGSRIESFSFIVSMAVGNAIIPIIGQNYGAKKYERVKEAEKIIGIIAVIYGLILSLMVFLIGKPIIHIFTTDSKVVALTHVYLIVIFLGSIGLNLYNWLSEAFNAVGKSILSLTINLIGTLLLLVPSTFIGSRIGGFNGMIIGLGVSQWVLGFITYKLSAIYLVDSKSI